MESQDAQYLCANCGAVRNVSGPVAPAGIRCPRCGGAMSAPGRASPADQPGESGPGVTLIDEDEDTLPEVIPDVGPQQTPVSIAPPADPLSQSPPGPAWAPSPPPSPPPAPLPAPPPGWFRPPGVAPVKADAGRVAIRMDVMEGIVSRLEAHPSLIRVFGVPVSRSLVVVADNGDLRVESNPDLSLADRDAQEFLGVLDQVMEESQGGPGATPAGPSWTPAPVAPAPAAVSPAAPSWTPPTPPAEQKLTVNCPKCGKEYHVTGADAGKRARCKACRTSFVVPDPAKARDELEERLRQANKDLDEVSTRYGLIIIIAAIVLVVLCWWILGFWKGLVLALIVGFGVLAGLGFLIGKRQKQVVEEKYRKTIQDLAAKANVSNTQLADLIKAKYKELSDVW